MKLGEHHVLQQMINDNVLVPCGSENSPWLPLVATQTLAAHVQAATDKKDVKLGHFDEAQPTMTEAIAMPGHPGHRMESKGS